MSLRLAALVAHCRLMMAGPLRSRHSHHEKAWLPEVLQGVCRSNTEQQRSGTPGTDAATSGSIPAPCGERRARGYQTVRGSL